MERYNSNTLFTFVSIFFIDEFLVHAITMDTELLRPQKKKLLLEQNEKSGQNDVAVQENLTREVISKKI